MEKELLTGKGIEQLLDMRRASLAMHNGEPHSMELVARIDDVAYINDSRSTFLDATLASLARLENNVVWICGPMENGVQQGHLRELLGQRVDAVIFFGNADRDEDLSARSNAAVYSTAELRTAVFLARELAKPGTTVLFSPACPSGNGFANYEERGVEFKRAVRDL